MIFRTSVALLAVMAMLITPVTAQAQNAFKAPNDGPAGAAVGPDLKSVTQTITGGEVTIGATSYVVALFKNGGTSPVNVKGINLYPSSTVSAVVSMNKCAESALPPDGECAVTVAVTGLLLGSWRVEVLLDHDGRTRLATAAITGNVVGTSEQEDEKIKLDVEATPEALDFQSVTGGVSSLVKPILLRNRTSDAITIEDLRLDTPENSGLTFRSECPDSLQAGQTCNILVTWAPTGKGPAQGVLLVQHSGKSGLTQVEINGSFEPSAVTNALLYPDSIPDRGLLISDKDKIDFGSGINGTAAITLSLVNAGSQDLALKNIKLSGSESGVSIARTGCAAGTVLKPVEACALTLNWIPVREGAIIDDLQIHHTGARGVLVLPVRGAATEAVSRESVVIHQTSDGMPMEESEKVQITPVLDGYAVTSHSPQRAVINGPVGSLVVRDGEDIVISGVKWTVTIVQTGVILTSAADEILLVFDRSLKASSITSSTTSTATTTNTNTSGTEDTNN